MYVAGSGVDRGVIRLELLVSDVERLSLVGRLSEVPESPSKVLGLSGAEGFTKV